jgi:predicted dehydrogenase
MNVAIFSFSSLIQRRILSALKAVLPDFTATIFTRRNPESLCTDSLKFLGHIKFAERSSFNSSQNRFHFDFAYVSSANSNHYQDLLDCSFAGLNTIVDKPAFINLENFQEIFQKFQSNKLLLFEAVAWTYHNQVNLFEHFQGQAGKLSAFSLFTIPSPTSTNFRNFDSSGSGVLHDMWSYAYSTACLLNLQDTLQIKSSNLQRGDHPQWFTCYSSNEVRDYQGIFGFGFPYNNTMILSGTSGSLSSERIFTSDPLQPVKVSLKVNTLLESVEYTSDAFANMLHYFLRIANGDDSEREAYLDSLESRYRSNFFSTLITFQR